MSQSGDGQTANRPPVSVSLMENACYTHYPGDTHTLEIVIGDNIDSVSATSSVASSTSPVCREDASLKITKKGSLSGSACRVMSNPATLSSLPADVQDLSDMSTSSVSGYIYLYFVPMINI